MILREKINYITICIDCHAITLNTQLYESDWTDSLMQIQCAKLCQELHLHYILRLTEEILLEQMRHQEVI